MTAIAASIAKFMRERWAADRTRSVPRNIGQGAMTREAEAHGRLDTWKALEVPERQVEAARRSANLSKGRNDAAISGVIAALIAEGLAVTQAAVAVRAGH